MIVVCKKKWMDSTFVYKEAIKLTFFSALDIQRLKQQPCFCIHVYYLNLNLCRGCKKIMSCRTIYFVNKQEKNILDTA